MAISDSAVGIERNSSSTAELRGSTTIIHYIQDNPKGRKAVELRWGLRYEHLELSLSNLMALGDLG